MQINRVVITGMGAVSPFGAGADKMYDSLCAGKTGVVNLKKEWQEIVSDLECWVGAPVIEELNEKKIPRRYRKLMGRTAILSYFAALEAIESAGITDEMLRSGEVGVCFGSSLGSIQSTAEFFSEIIRTSESHQLSSGMFFQVMSHTAAANLAHVFGITGRVLAANAACASSLQSIGVAYEQVRYGMADIMICGGAEELHAYTSTSFDIVQGTSTHYNDSPSDTPRPFDRDRDGTVCGEGAGCLIIESEESAKKRGATILAEIIGFQTSASGEHMSHSNAESIVSCMRKTLQSAGINPEDVDYINAHATATELGDLHEAQAIEEVFNGHKIPVSSLKGYMGHTLGASGALELIASVFMMRDQQILPTRNLSNPDDAAKNLRHVTSIEPAKLDIILKNSFAFGGINTALLIRSYKS